MEIPPDVCSFGHALAPGSSSITITETDPMSGAILNREDKLLRNHHVMVPGRYRTEELVIERETWGFGGPPVGSKVVIQVADEPGLTMAELSPFDPTGLAPADCAHGIPRHPDDRINSKNYGARSWIRAKYLDLNRTSPKGPPRVVCPVCLGEPAPDDLAVAANA